MRVHSATGNPTPSTLTQVTDLTGTGLTTKATTSFESSGDNVYFNLDGSYQVKSSATYSTHFTFIVIGSKDNNSNGRLITANSGNRLFGWWSGSKQCWYNLTEIYGVLSNNTTNDGAEHIFVGRNDNDTKTFWNNTTKIVTSSTDGDNGWGNVNIGKDEANSESASGKIYEFLGFDKALYDGSVTTILNTFKKYYTQFA